MVSCSVWFSAPSFWMGGGLENRCVGRVYGADGAVHGTIHTVHTTYAAALKTTTHPKTRCRKPYAATQHLMRVARHHPHRTHDPRSGSQDHHPSKSSVHKTICCNRTCNGPDDGRYVPETCRAKNTSIKLPSCIKLAFHFISK